MLSGYRKFSSILINNTAMQSKKTLTKVNELDSNTFVVCLECNTKHPQITHTHLKKAHGITLKEYKFKYGLATDNLYCLNVRQLRKVTLENMIKKYGEREGINKWNLYKQKQSYSNSFEYKQQKYGWTKEQFDDYNNNRASTKSNFIKRHGKEEGLIRWKEYRKRQSYAGVTEEYFVEKYGFEEGILKFKQSCASKANTIDSFIQRYGEIIGKEKWERLADTRSKYVRQSSLANNLFNEILNNLPQEIHSSVFFDSKHSEYFFAKRGYKTMFVDFYVASSRKVIEFAGDYWHRNPEVYKPDFYVHQAKSSAKDLYQKTIERNLVLETIHSCEVLLVWENEYKKNKEEILHKCLNFLNEQ